VDPDHIGSLGRILEIAPRLRIITTYLALGKMNLFRPLPLDRVYLLNPGQTVPMGDRTITAIKPPTYDAPETTGLYDPKTEALFSADCFGCLMTEPAEQAAAIGSKQLKEGLLTWATVDSPWLHSIDRSVFAGNLDAIRNLSPKMILSSHLPAAVNMTEDLLRLVAEAPEQKPFAGPDQAAFEAMIKGRAAAA
jgi:flavorubredoxin